MTLLTDYADVSGVEVGAGVGVNQSNSSPNRLRVSSTSVPISAAIVPLATICASRLFSLM